MKRQPLSKKRSHPQRRFAGCSLNLFQTCNFEERSQNEFTDWFGEDFEKLDIFTTFNLVYNAAIMIEAGIGYAVTIDKIANTSESRNLCFRSLKPRLDSGLNIV